VAPVLIERIVDARARCCSKHPPPAAVRRPAGAAEAQRVPGAQPAGRRDGARGTAARAQATLQRTDLYGKTGTTNDAVDAWFAGFQPGLVAVAWMGHDEPRSLGERESGGGLALPAWIDAWASCSRAAPSDARAAASGAGCSIRRSACRSKLRAR
jgi:penicillin-binding protein 1A